MAPLIVTMWTTLDGYVAGPADAMDWLRPDADMMQYETGLVEEAGTLLLGRITHADFASYWPAVARGEIDADAGTQRYARRLDALDKVVVSASGAIADWKGTRRLEDVTTEGIREIVATSSGPALVYGSLSVIEALARLHLIDQLDLVVHPVLLREGRALLAPGQPPMGLELKDSRPFTSGAVLLRYATG